MRGEGILNRRMRQTMNRQEIFQWVNQRYNTIPDYPWSDENAVLRHADNRKWYGLIMEIRREKLGLEGAGTADIINLKCEPLLIGSLRGREGFHPAYHMNKDQWISIRLDGSVAGEELKDLIDLSYELTKKKTVRRG